MVSLSRCDQRRARPGAYVETVLVPLSPIGAFHADFLTILHRIRSPADDDDYYGIISQLTKTNRNVIGALFGAVTEVSDAESNYADVIGR